MFDSSVGSNNYGDFPNNSPNTNALDGLEDGGGSLGALYPISDAAAIVVGVPGNWKTRTVMNNSAFYQDLSQKVNTPVFVGGVKTKVVIFDGENDPVIFNPRKH